MSRLSVFVGGWTLEAAEEVCGRGLERTDTWQVLDILTGLIDKSLAVYEERDGAGRYRLLETVRQYAFEKLQEQDAAAVSRAHLDYFLGYAEAARRHQAGPAEAQWLERLEAEQDNLRAALAWARSGGPEMTELRSRLRPITLLAGAGKPLGRPRFLIGGPPVRRSRGDGS